MKKTFLFLFGLMLCSGQLLAQETPIDNLVEKGNKLFDKGDDMGAIAAYREALAIDSNSPRANYEMANTYINTGKYPEAIRYADKVIKSRDKIGDQAYVIKGTALDIMEKYDEAIQTYKEGIKRYPETSLLEYNIGITYINQKQFSEAELHGIRAVELDPDHASSHLLLAQSAYYRGERVQSILSLYYFLLLEPDSKRSASALELLRSLLRKGVSQGTRKDGKNQINIAVTDSKDEFHTVDMMISMTAAFKYTDTTNKSDAALFYDQTKSVLSIITELKDKKKSKNIWWNFYVAFYDKLKASGNMETFCYFISASSKDKGVQDWLDANKSKTDKLISWYNSLK